MQAWREASLDGLLYETTLSLLCLSDRLLLINYSVLVCCDRLLSINKTVLVCYHRLLLINYSVLVCYHHLLSINKTVLVLCDRPLPIKKPAQHYNRLELLIKQPAPVTLSGLFRVSLRHKERFLILQPSQTPQYRWECNVFFGTLLRASST